MSEDRKSELPRERIIPLWLIFIVLAMFAFALLGERGALRAFQTYRHKQDLEQRLTELLEQQSQLRAEIQMLQKDRDYWEQLARKELGMVREGELIYQFSGDEK